MNKPSKCKNCQWYGKPYWSIINPCDSCPMENVETFTQWVDPTIKQLQREKTIMQKYFQMIIDIGFDYDGYNDSENLKKLIDELVTYAVYGRDADDTKTMYVDRDKEYNILMEEIKVGGDNVKDN